MDLVNRFGQLDGFQILLDRFTKGPPLSVPVVASLIKYVVCFLKKKKILSHSHLSRFQCQPFYSYFLACFICSLS